MRRPVTGLLVFAGLVAVLTPLGEPAPRPVLAVMAMGDSITLGYSTMPDGSAYAGDGYRGDLAARLRRRGLSPSFVGSCPDPDPAWKCVADRHQSADDNHEGHAGWRIHQLTSVAWGLVIRHRPTVVLLHIGTNDIPRTAEMAGAPQRLEALIDTIRAASSEVHVFVATPVYLPGHAAAWAAYRDAIPGIVDARPRTYLVPQHVVGAKPGELADGIHPTPCGYARMAFIWYRHLGRAAISNLGGADWPAGYYPFDNPSAGVCAGVA